MAKITPELIKEVHKKSTKLISESTLSDNLDILAKKISKDFKDTNPIFVCCMNGGLMTLSEIVKRLDFPFQIDYIQATRYIGTEGKEMKWVKTHSISPENRTVIIVDDILDGGITLTNVVDYYDDLNSKDVKTIVLLDKKTQRVKGGLEKPDYFAMYVDDFYVYGFGLDYHGYLRNYPAIYSVADEHMF